MAMIEEVAKKLKHNIIENFAGTEFGEIGVGIIPEAWQRRLAYEYVELLLRIERLELALCTKNDPILNKQKDAMYQYAGILSDRIFTTPEIVEYFRKVGLI